MFFLSKKCDICFQNKMNVKKNKRGWNICNDCKNLALNKMSINEFQNANIEEISYAVRNGSLSKTIELIESQHYSTDEALNKFKLNREDISLILKNNEVCYYYGSARSYNEKKIITEYKNSSLGLSVKIAKGLTLRSGSSTTIPIRYNVSETFEGKLYITNKRIILLTKKYGFDLELNNINAIEPFNNGFILFCKNKSYVVITYDNSTIFYVFELIKKNLSGKGTEKTAEKESFNQLSDDLYNKAKELVIELQKASASLIQLKLKIDYDTALKIISRMETEGIVEPANGSKPRKVLIKKY